MSHRAHHIGTSYRRTFEGRTRRRQESRLDLRHRFFATEQRQESTHATPALPKAATRNLRLAIQGNKFL